MRNKIISVFFCLVLTLGIVAGLVTPDRRYSDSEKRRLAHFPTISFAAFTSGKLGDAIENYLADQFPARDAWVTGKTLVELAMGKRDVGGVYFAKDGYLIEKFDGYSAAQYKANIAALAALTEKLGAEGITLRVMLVPTAVETLADKLPAFATHADQRKLFDYAASQGLHVVDTFETLDAHKDEAIYYKTDHHYTSLGAYYCYAAWKTQKGETALPLSAWTHEVLCDNFRGTTYSKVNYTFAPYDTIDAYYKTDAHRVEYNGGASSADSIYAREYLDGKDQYAAFLNSNQATTVVYGGGDGKLLIVKDSYANCFAQFVVDDYAETHLIDPRFYKGAISDYVRENGIDEVLVLYNLPNFATDTAAVTLR